MAAHSAPRVKIESQLIIKLKLGRKFRILARLSKKQSLDFAKLEIHKGPSS